jgi:hypothetical protein
MYTIGENKMKQEQVHKGTLQAYSEKNGGVLIGEKWYSTNGIEVATLSRFKRKPIVAQMSEDGRFVTKIDIDYTVQQTFAPKKTFGRSEEDNRRIARQATLNTATAIYDLALRTSAGSFNTPIDASPAQLAEAIKTEVIRIAKDLENHVYQ